MERKQGKNRKRHRSGDPFCETPIFCGEFWREFWWEVSGPTVGENFGACFVSKFVPPKKYFVPTSFCRRAALKTRCAFLEQGSLFCKRKDLPGARYRKPHELTGPKYASQKRSGLKTQFSIRHFRAGIRRSTRFENADLTRNALASSIDTQLRPAIF